MKLKLVQWLLNYHVKILHKSKSITQPNKPTTHLTRAVSKTWFRHVQDVSKTRVDRVWRVKLVDSCRTQSKRVRHASGTCPYTDTPLIWACPCFRDFCSGKYKINHFACDVCISRLCIFSVSLIASVFAQGNTKSTPLHVMYVSQGCASFSVLLITTSRYPESYMQTCKDYIP